MFPFKDFDDFMLFLCVKICRVLSLLAILWGPAYFVLTQLWLSEKIVYVSFSGALYQLATIMAFLLPAAVLLYGISVVFDRFRERA